MIYHVSFGVRDPERVAHVLAALAGALSAKLPPDVLADALGPPPV